MLAFPSMITDAAEIPVDKLKQMTLEDFLNAGLEW